MIDVHLLRDDLPRLRAAVARKGAAVDVDALAALDATRRRLIGHVEAARAEQRRAGREIAAATGAEKQRRIDAMSALAARLSVDEAELARVEVAFEAELSRVPNPPHESVPDGGEGDATVVATWGEPRRDPVDPHHEIGPRLGLVDMERGARASGSRFYYLRGKAALLELALVRFAIDRLVAEGFEPVVPPVLVREAAMYGTGFFPADRFEIWKVEDEDLYLVGTSEVPLAAMHMGEILDPATLPLRYAGISTCFRREAGAHGKDTKGTFRVHQFDKVEMFSFTHPAASWDEHEYLRSIEEGIFRALALPYRVVNIAAGDLGASAAKKYDIEAWLPSEGTFREVTSCSNCTDFQARRLNCRIRGNTGTEFVHTLNGTAIAVARTISFLLEVHQRPDGSVAVPEVLVPYTGFETI